MILLKINQGKKTGKSRISKQGNVHIRRAMHFPALNVVRYDVGGFKALQERIYERSGLKMKGYVAVQRKLLCLFYTLWKNNQEFNFESQINNVTALLSQTYLRLGHLSLANDFASKVMALDDSVINIGDKVRVDTRSGDYKERLK